MDGHPSGSDVFWVYTRQKSQEAKIKLIQAGVPPACVQMKWHQLKVCSVPNWQNKSFGDIVDYLHEKVLPADQKQSFLLSGYNGDADSDDDNEDESGQ